MNKIFRETMLMVRGALFLDNAMFNELKEAAGVFSKCLVTLIIIGLLVGLVNGVFGLAASLTRDPAAEIDKAIAELDQNPLFNANPNIPEIKEYIIMGMRIGGRVEAELPGSPLPRPVGQFFHYLGVMISTPFGWLGGLLFSGALVHIFAKLLGGRATIAQMWGLTLLSVAPRLLEILSAIFNAVPGASSIAGLLGFVVAVWSFLIYIRATAVAQEFSNGKAFLAIILPWIVSVLLFIVLGLLVGLVAAL